MIEDFPHAPRLTRSLGKPILLNFDNLSNKFCPSCYLNNIGRTGASFRTACYQQSTLLFKRSSGKENKSNAKTVLKYFEQLTKYGR